MTENTKVQRLRCTRKHPFVCGYEWDFTGESPLLTCPKCGHKMRNPAVWNKATDRDGDERKAHGRSVAEVVEPAGESEEKK